MVGPIIDHWTVDHFLFGIGITCIIWFLSKCRYRVSGISLFIVLLWELFEFREYGIKWVIDYGNNIVDVIVGFIGIVLTINVMERFSKK